MGTKRNRKLREKQKKRRRVRMFYRVLRIIIVLFLLGITYLLVQKSANQTKQNKEDTSTSQIRQETDVKDNKSTDKKPVEKNDNPAKTNEKEIKDFTILFTGDILFSQYVLNNESNAGIDGIIADDLQKEMQNAEITMVNQEFPFSTRGAQAEDKQFTFRVNPQKVDLFKQLGIDIVTLANNHSLDFGVDALVDSFATLDQAGIKYVGAGDSLERAKQLEIINAGGRKVGFLAASRVIPEVSWNVENKTPGVFCTYDSTMLVNEIKESKKKCDYTVVYVHWGVERNNTPEEYQKQLAREYIDAGADIVIGSHPHVLQGIEYYNGKPIIYSLGNFIFGRSIEKTAALKVTINSNQESQLQVIPCSASNAYTTKLEDQNAQNLYDYLEGISYSISINEEGKVIRNEE
ncbi:CapA family protein [Anaerosacchariphilus polymeriproducens]|uniref:CapA family protein n=1 Tax=Anaerosacchariphilus polymeriproducens TaxID=1812858 RepID=A0A371AY02_9FIRM|nr:CapA family protein [Anaerosacchariphilus polymeriproducens]RDU24427.1 CapA family protein [Anaerosacchariphilus polymeriproducens]